VENERFKIPYRGDESDIEEKEEEEREKAAMYIREAAEEVAAAEEYDEEGDWLEGAIERLNIAKRHAAAVEQRQKARAEEHEVSEAAMWIREAEAEVAAAEKYDEEGDWLESATERLNNAKRHALKSTANSPSKP
jgi:DNA repair ATPase RecN